MPRYGSLTPLRAVSAPQGPGRADVWGRRARTHQRTHASPGPGSRIACTKAANAPQGDNRSPTGNGACDPEIPPCLQEEAQELGGGRPEPLGVCPLCERLGWGSGEWRRLYGPESSTPSPRLSSDMHVVGVGGKIISSPTRPQRHIVVKTWV